MYEEIEEQKAKMNYWAEQMDQAQNAKAQCATQAATGSIGGYSLDTLGRPGIRDRAERQKHEAQSQVLKATALAELCDLLAKHPDIARILDLVEQVRG